MDNDHKETIRVMVVDDHDMIRHGLSVLLDTQDDLILVAEASTGDLVLKICEEVHPDVVLMDLIMPGMDGVTAIRLLKQAFPEIQVIVLTNYTDEDLVREALELGAIGYLLKNVSAHELSEAIHAAYHGKPAIAPEATRVLIEAATQPPRIGYELTSRELEVLTLLVRGQTNREIADLLFISQSTVKNHVSNILSKLNAANRTEAVTLAIQHGLVRQEDINEP